MHLAWNARNVSEQRLKFAIRANSGKEEMKALCQEFGISRPTGYTWLKRFRGCERLQELGERSRRPHHSPRQTAREIEEQVIAQRRARPDWGAQKLIDVLKQEGIIVPRITAHRILLRNGLVREQDRHRAAVRRFERESPNQLWQMDFKGMPESRKGCLPLVVLDDHSRYLNGLFDTDSTQAEPVRNNLITVFRRDGLPEAMLMDHGTPWWNMQAQSGWTWLTVWIMRQGIRLYLSGYGHPQTQGKVERCNGSLEHAMRKRPKAAEQNWQEWLDQYREEYNHVRPHEALGMDVPAQHWSPSTRPYLENPKAWDYPDPVNVRKVRENGGVCLQGSSYYVGRAFVGENVQLEFLENTVLAWYCRTLVRQFDLKTRESHFINYGQFDKARTRGL